MRVERELVVNAPREVIWAYITDPGNYTTFFSGITRWDVEGRRRRGCGARYRMLMRVGSVEVGGLVEVVEFEEPGDMAWTSVLGLDQRGRWRLRERGPNRTSVMYRMSYHAPGGLLGWLTDQISAPIVRNYVRHTLENLKRHIESSLAEQSRTPGAKPAKRQAARA
ncbi:MAG: SRPBCC family protein [Thermoleophilaceae bacterium]